MDDVTRTGGLFVNPFTGESRTIPQGVVIREGRADDQECINELCRDVKFVASWDFMPGLWLSWINNPTTIVIVAETGGKVVSVAGLLISNKGKHWTSFGSRSSPSVRGKNVFWACSAHMIALAVTRYGRPEKFNTVCASFPIAVKTREGGKMNYRAVGFKHNLWAGHRISGTDLQRVADHLSSYSMQQETTTSCHPQDHVVTSSVQTDDELAQLFADNDTNFTLFPEGYVKVTYGLFEAIPQSAYDVWDPEMRWFTVARESHEEGQGCVTSLSVLTSCSVEGGSSVTFEVYGDTSVDAVVRHLRLQLPHIQRGHEK